jgi:hypothetical protein
LDYDPDSNRGQDTTSQVSLGNCVNPAVDVGDPLFEIDRNEYSGTLGPIMSTHHRGRTELTYVALTAGHVIPNGADILIVRSRVDGSAISLAVPLQSRRLNDRPISRQADKPSFLDDCGFLVIDYTSIHLFNHVIPNLNPYYFQKHAVPQAVMSDPARFGRYKDIKSKLRTSSIVVYKKGASTDLTMGYLVNVTKKTPKGWYEQSTGGQGEDRVVENEESNEGSNEELSQGSTSPINVIFAFSDSEMSNIGISTESEDENTQDWLGIVRWADMPFADSGDSGSLVFAFESGIFVPLGVHIGSQNGRSYFICLESFCYEGEKEGWDLKLTIDS